MMHIVTPLAKQIEKVAEFMGFHVALTGGQLYKDGPRKDIDFVFYRIRGQDGFHIQDLYKALEGAGLLKLDNFYGFVQKAHIEAPGATANIIIPVDLMFPEYDEDFAYPEETDDATVPNTTVAKAPTTPPRRLEFVKECHARGMAIWFRWPLWDYWMYIDQPTFNSNVHYMVTSDRPQPGDPWMRPLR